MKKVESAPLSSWATTSNKYGYYSRPHCKNDVTNTSPSRDVAAAPYYTTSSEYGEKRLAKHGDNSWCQGDVFGERQWQRTAKFPVKLPPIGHPQLEDDRRRYAKTWGGQGRDVNKRFFNFDYKPVWKDPKPDRFKKPRKDKSNNKRVGFRGQDETFTNGKYGARAGNIHWQNSSPLFQSNIGDS